MKKCFLLILLVAATTVSACATRSPIRWTATAATSSPLTKPSIPTLIPEPTSEPYVIVDLTMNVRNGPGTEFDVIGQIESQNKYAVIGKHVDWWLVELGNNQSAWVYAPGNVTRFFGNADAVPDIASPPTPTSEIISACTPANKNETPAEGLGKAYDVLISFFELLNQHQYEQAVSWAEYHFTVEFLNQDDSLLVRGPCCGGNATDSPPESQFDYTVIRNCAGEFLVLQLPVYVP